MSKELQKKAYADGFLTAAVSEGKTLDEAKAMFKRASAVAEAAEQRREAYRDMVKKAAAARG